MLILLLRLALISAFLFLLILAAAVFPAVIAAHFCSSTSLNLVVGPSLHIVAHFVQPFAAACPAAYYFPVHISDFPLRLPRI